MSATTRDGFSCRSRGATRFPLLLIAAVPGAAEGAPTRPVAARAEEAKLVTRAELLADPMAAPTGIPAASASPGPLRPRALTAAQWLSDVDALESFLKATHPNLYRKTPREELDRRFARLRAAIPSLSEQAIIARLGQIVALARDGHTTLMGNRLSETYFPVRIEPLKDGYFVTAVSRKYGELFGARILRLGAHRIETAFDLAAEASSHDNSSSRMYGTPRQLMMSSFLVGLGIIASPDRLPIQARYPDGRIATVEVEAAPSPFREDRYFSWFWKLDSVPALEVVDLASQLRDTLPLRLRHPEKPYWFESVPERRAIYFAFNSCENSGDEPFADFVDRLWIAVEREKADKLIIDLRNNFGGTNSYLQPLIHGLIRHDRINRPGHLFVLIGRKTFSAAVHAATWIERNVPAIFVGEATGAGPNHYADPESLELPHSGILLMVSHVYWQNGWPWDERESIDPAIRADMDSRQYFGGGDEPLQKALEYRRPESPGP